MRQLTPRRGLFLAVAAALAVGTCARQVRNVQLTPDAPAVLGELWQAPAGPRDLFHGPGAEAGAPRETVFTFVAEDTTGWSPGPSSSGSGFAASGREPETICRGLKSRGLSSASMAIPSHSTTEVFIVTSFRP